MAEIGVGIFTTTFEHNSRVDNEEQQKTLIILLCRRCSIHRMASHRWRQAALRDNDTVASEYHSWNAWTKTQHSNAIMPPTGRTSSECESFESRFYYSVLSVISVHHCIYIISSMVIIEGVYFIIDASFCHFLLSHSVVFRVLVLFYSPCFSLLF